MRRVLPLAGILLLGTGCVDRFLSIKSDPPGATVTVDGKKAGETPCELKFVWYGGREISLEREGYLSETHVEPVDAPWYQFPVLDFITDVLLPFKITDRRTFEYKLQKLEIDPQSLDDVRRRADELRRMAHEGRKEYPWTPW